MEISRLIAYLEDSDLQRRTEAKQALVRYGSEAVPQLMAVMLELQGRRCWEAGSVLAQIDDIRIAEAFLRVIQSNHPILKQTAIKALGRYVYDESIFKQLLAFLEDSDPLVQLRAIEAFEGQRDARLLDPLVRIVQTTLSSTVRYSAIELLGELGDPSAMPAILAHQHDPDHHVRDRVAVALARLNSASL